MKKNPAVIAITMGDPGGIGPEIVAKALKKRRSSSGIAFLVIGAREVFERLRKRSGLSVYFREISDLKKGSLKGGIVYFLDISKDIPRGGRFQMGKISRENGFLALKILEKAASLAGRGLVQGIVTAPIHKTAVQLVNKKFVGHTEFFAQKTKTKRYAMMFVSPRLKVTLVTIHIPLKKVHSLLAMHSILEKILLTYDMLRQNGIKKPRIAVCALNPHGNEFGGEEDKVISPAVCQARKKGIDVKGPFSADLLFHAAYHGKYDALISMYHDQALGPFKLAAFHDGVNVTLGLPYIRTSPDHGTAFDIAYQNKADPSSMIAALQLAQKLVLNRYV